MTTVGHVAYDFQGAGEFTALRGKEFERGEELERGKELEIQTRQTPVPTAPAVPPIPANAYTGLSTCVSIYTAVAARVGKHRVSYQPNISGDPDPSGMQLWVDHILTKLGPEGINLGVGRIVQPWGGNGIEIDYSDGTILVVTSAWWPSQQKWYLNVAVYGTTATKGIMGLTKDAWLPALPDGASLGPKPQRQMTATCRSTRRSPMRGA